MQAITNVLFTGALFSNVFTLFLLVWGSSPARFQCNIVDSPVTSLRSSVCCVIASCGPKFGYVGSVEGWPRSGFLRWPAISVVVELGFVHLLNFSFKLCKIYSNVFTIFTGGPILRRWWWQLWIYRLSHNNCKGVLVAIVWCATFFTVLQFWTDHLMKLVPCRWVYMYSSTLTRLVILLAFLTYVFSTLVCLSLHVLCNVCIFLDEQTNKPLLCTRIYSSFF